MDNYTKEILKLARPLENKQGIGPLVASLKDKKVVMIGEASHGTKEFYDWRQHITQELIMNHGFHFVAVEGDWPPCHKVNQFVNGKLSVNSHDALGSFTRWPTWMWANMEFLWFTEWLKDWNHAGNKQVGLHGLDVYSLFESMDSVLTVLNRIDPKIAKMVQEKYNCMESFRHDEKSYAKSLFKAPEGCQKEIIEVLSAMLEKKINNLDHKDAWFDIKQNAKIVHDAENYYRAMVFGEDDSWNVRDTHMMSTLEMLLEHYGPESKGIVWEHNTHIGDYRATDMALSGQVNIGGLARQIYGSDQVGLVGLGSYTGSVTASYAWNGPSRVFDLPEARQDSVEYICHSIVPKVGAEDFYMIFDPLDHSSPLNQVKGHRAVGVVYDPDLEHRGNYVPTSLANRYDAFVFLDHTHALAPLHIPYDHKKFPDTYPHGNRL